MSKSSICVPLYSTDGDTYSRWNVYKPSDKFTCNNQKRGIECVVYCPIIGNFVGKYLNEPDRLKQLERMLKTESCSSALNEMVDQNGVDQKFYVPVLESVGHFIGLYKSECDEFGIFCYCGPKKTTLDYMNRQKCETMGQCTSSQSYRLLKEYCQRYVRRMVWVFARTLGLRIEQVIDNNSCTNHDKPNKTLTSCPSHIEMLNVASESNNSVNYYDMCCSHNTSKNGMNSHIIINHPREDVQLVTYDCAKNNNQGMFQCMYNHPESMHHKKNTDESMYVHSENGKHRLCCQKVQRFKPLICIDQC
jgi:hypothetical protein